MTIAIVDNEITRDSDYALRTYAQIPLESNTLLVKYFLFFFNNFQNLYCGHIAIKTKQINCCMLHVAVNGLWTSGTEHTCVPETPFFSFIEVYFDFWHSFSIQDLYIRQCWAPHIKFLTLVEANVFRWLNSREKCS